MIHILTSFAQASTYTYGYNYHYDSGAHLNGPFPWVVFLTWMAIILIVTIFLIVCQWRVYQKAGRPGWASIIPIYNTWVLFEIVGYPGWWAILGLVPFVSIFTLVMAVVATFKLGKAFGKGDMFSILLVLFPLFLYPVLAFGSAEFRGTDSDGSGAAPTQPGAMPSAGQTPSSAASQPAPSQPQESSGSGEQRPPQVPPANPTSV